MTILQIEALEPRQLLSTVHPLYHILPNIFTGYNPFMLRHAYGFDKISYLSNYNAGEGQTIAVVDPWVDRQAPFDLGVFDTAEGLPAANIQLVDMSLIRNNIPGIESDYGWGIETALDVEWAHAIAPAAKILLVCGLTNSSGDLTDAVDYARNIPGVSAVSISWGAGDIPVTAVEQGYREPYFRSPASQNVTFVAASGDDGSRTLIWPAVFPQVVAAGGTSLQLGLDGTYLNETGWSGSGGGTSITWPNRTVPDISYNSDPNTGYPVFSSEISTVGDPIPGWNVLGGTSAAAPQLAALVAIVNQGRALLGLSATNHFLADLKANPFELHDIVTGNNGAFSAGPGYDLVTGYGTPKADLIAENADGHLPLTPNQIVLDGLYQKILERHVDPSGAKVFGTMLDEGAPKLAIITYILSSHEFHRLEVARDYGSLLHRVPDQFGLDAWSSLLDAGFTNQWAQSKIAASEEFFNLSQTSDNQFVENLYALFLHRVPTTLEQDAWVSVIEKSSRDLAASAIVNSLEADQNLIAADYQHYAGRAPTGAERTAWTNYLLGGGREETLLGDLLVQ